MFVVLVFSFSETRNNAKKSLDGRGRGAMADDE
jgi:hypothetical protein